MKRIENNPGRFKKKKKKPPPHDLSAMTELIKEEIGFNQKYGRGYWLRHLKKSKISYGELIGVLKEISNLPLKYNKGGRLTNILNGKVN